MKLTIWAIYEDNDHPTVKDNEADHEEVSRSIIALMKIGQADEYEVDIDGTRFKIVKS